MTEQYQQANINASPDADANSLFSGASAGVAGLFYGSVNTEVTRWDESTFVFNEAIERGEIEVSDSATLGTTFIIRETGLWLIEFRWQFPAGAVGSMGISTGGTNVISGTSPSVAAGASQDPAAASSLMLNASHEASVGPDAFDNPVFVRFLCNSGVDPDAAVGGECVFRKIGNFI